MHRFIVLRQDTDDRLVGVRPFASPQIYFAIIVKVSVKAGLWHPTVRDQIHRCFPPWMLRSVDKKKNGCGNKAVEKHQPLFIARILMVVIKSFNHSKDLWVSINYRVDKYYKSESVCDSCELLWPNVIAKMCWIFYLLSLQITINVYRS